jgi:hypothetical protein
VVGAGIKDCLDSLLIGAVDDEAKREVGRAGVAILLLTLVAKRLIGGGDEVDAEDAEEEELDDLRLPVDVVYVLESISATRFVTARWLVVSEARCG